MIRINPESKRARLALRFFTYGVMTITTIVVSAISFMFALGYRIDNESFKVEQGGLVQFVSSPADAMITIDGEQQDYTTPGKANLSPGTHEIAMSLEGYRGWNKSIDIEAGEILWLNYTRFVPNSITTTSVREFDTLAASLTSPNKRFMALQPSTADPSLTIASIRNEDNVTFEDVTIPAAAYTQTAGQGNTFEIVEWNLDGRYLLIKHTIGDLTEFIRFDRENPSAAINLTSKFGPITRAQFAGNNGNVLFATINGELRRIPVNGTETEVLAEGVKSFSVYRGDTVSFIAERNDQQEVGVIKDDRETVVSEFPIGTDLKVALSHYFNRDYLAISHGQQIDIIREPTAARTAVSKVFTTFSVDEPSVEWLYFSNNGRFIVAQHQASFTTYDLELAETYERSFNTDQVVTRPFRWLDDYYLWIDLNDNLRMVEFDGANERAITSVASGYSATLSDNADVLFSIGRNSVTKKLQLQSSNLTVEE